MSTGKTIHFVHYLVLIIMLVIGIGAFFAVWGNQTAQLTVGITTAVGYLLWGIIHHVLSGDLHPKIVVEYILIVAIAIVLLITSVV